MDPLAVVLVLVAVALTVWIVAAPLQRGHAEETARAHEAELADLEAAKAARYREIREAEMDFRTGKLSEADWRAIDRELRAEAVAILQQLDRLGATAPEAEPVRVVDAPVAEAREAPAGAPADVAAEAHEEHEERVVRPPAA